MMITSLGIYFEESHLFSGVMSRALQMLKELARMKEMDEADIMFKPLRLKCSARRACP
jgi:hypothetical protein